MITTFPNNILTTPTQKVSNFDETLVSISQSLESEIRKYDNVLHPWLGIAANQIGISKAIFVLKIKNGLYRTFFNPIILETKWLLPSIGRCMSLRGLYLPMRPFNLKIEYQDINGDTKIDIFRGPKAAVIQHEMEHLNGIILSDIAIKLF